ncbi:unnamed protein product [Effrenium voratum]|nr:unnamed protein product [Effrenium voratum]
MVACSHLRVRRKRFARLSMAERVVVIERKTFLDVEVRSSATSRTRSWGPGDRIPRTTTCEDVSDPAIVTRESSTEPSPTQTSTDPCVFFSSQRGCALGAACGFRHGAGEITGPRPRKVTRDKLKAVIARVCKNLEDPNTHAKLQKLAGGCHYLRSLIIQKLNDDASSCARRHG